MVKNRYEIHLRFHHSIFLQQDFHWFFLRHLSYFIYRWFSTSWPNHFGSHWLFCIDNFCSFNFDQRKLSQPSHSTLSKAASNIICFSFHICDAMCAWQILNLLKLVTLTSTRNYLLFAMGHIFVKIFLFLFILILKVFSSFHRLLLLLLCLWNCLKTLLHWKVSSRWHAYIFICDFISGHCYHSAYVVLSKPSAECVSECCSQTKFPSFAAAVVVVPFLHKTMKANLME